MPFAARQGELCRSSPIAAIGRVDSAWDRGHNAANQARVGGADVERELIASTIGMSTRPSLPTTDRHDLTSRRFPNSTRTPPP